MIFIHDTRDKIGKHDNVESYLTENGHKIVRSKLYVGDISLLKNQSVCIDLKQGLQEVYGNVIIDNARFKRELTKALSANIELIILVEESGIGDLFDVATWVNPRREKWHEIHKAQEEGKRLGVKIAKRPPASGAKLAAKMHQLERVYGIKWMFCGKEETGARVVKILGGDDAV